MEFPVEFVGNRFFVVTDGLRLYTDTGGGYWISRVAVERLGLRVTTEETEEGRLDFVELPFEPGREIPVLDQEFPWADGLLGAPWFAGRVWTFDYANGRLLTDGAIAEDTHTIALRGSPYATIEASIAGETFPFLFDTGATVQAADGDRGTCFLIGSLFDRWRAMYGWPVAENVDQGVAPAMHAPEVIVAGHTVGPVEFGRRPDANFHEWMAQWTDGPTDGALGGSLFRYFCVTADYPGSRVRFDRVRT